MALLDENGLRYFWTQLKAKFAASSHTHNYAGSSSAGGSANSAVKLDTATAGSATQPVYFTGGKPVATTYTLGKSVPSNAVFTDTNNKTTQTAVTAGDYTNWRPILWGASNSSTEGFAPTTVTDGAFTANTLTVQPSSGTIRATTFKGALSGNATTATTASKIATNAGSTTQPVYFANGVPVATTYTLGKSVPADAKFTDTNTWRGIQDNLTSDSATDSLSAKQGKALKTLIDGKAASSHTHAYLPLAGGTVTGATAFTNTTASTNKSTGAVKISGGMGVAGRMSANEVMIGDGCTLMYNTTNKCVDFVFS